MNDTVIRIGVINVSDRASAGVYEDLPGKEAVAWLREALASEWALEYAVVPDERSTIAATLKTMADESACCLVITTGGTGPAPRDVTPEATADVCDRLLPGFGEAMRSESRKTVPTAILSRQIAGIREKTVIINLPGKPRAIRECLEVIASALPYCVFLVSGVQLRYCPERAAGYQPG